MESPQRIDRVIAPVPLEVEPPVPDGGLARPIAVPESQAVSDVPVHIEDVVRQCRADQILLLVRIEDLPVELVLVETGPGGRRIAAAFGVVAIGRLDVGKPGACAVQDEEMLARLREPVGER
jgi:hypothetical protein